MTMANGHAPQSLGSASNCAMCDRWARRHGVAVFVGRFEIATQQRLPFSGRQSQLLNDVTVGPRPAEPGFVPPLRRSGIDVGRLVARKIHHLVDGAGRPLVVLVSAGQAYDALAFEHLLAQTPSGPNR